MTVLPAEVGTGRVWCDNILLVSAINNGQPSASKPDGVITFTPMVRPWVADSKAAAISLPKSSQIKITAGSFSTYLLATDDPTSSPTGWTYLVTVELDGWRRVEMFSIEVPQGSNRNLADISPALSSTGIPITKGVSITSAIVDVNAHLVLTMSDGSTIDAGVVSESGQTTLNKLLTVDGSGSGLDADLLDGKQAAAFANATVASAAATDLNTLTTAGSYTLLGGGGTTALHYPVDNVNGYLSVISTDANNVAQRYVASPSNDSRVWERTKAGTWGVWYLISSAGFSAAGTGIDSDTIDGKHAAAFYDISPKPIASGTDLNTLMTAGVYYATTNAANTLAANWPSASFGGWLEVLQGSTINHWLQRASNSAGTTIWQRGTYNGTTWSAWLPIVGTGSDADTVDGKHATDFVAATAYTAADVKTKLISAGPSGVDADTLDGKHASTFYDTSPKLITTGTDLNTVKTAGVYYANTNAANSVAMNWPYPSFGGWVEIIQGSTANHWLQRATLYSGNVIWQRDTYTGTTWTPWTVVMGVSTVDKTLSLDTYTTTGWYASLQGGQSSTLQYPEAVNGYLEVKSYDANNAMQTYRSALLGDNRLWIRSRVGGVWDSWREATPSVATGAKAARLDVSGENRDVTANVGATSVTFQHNLGQNGQFSFKKAVEASGRVIQDSTDDVAPFKTSWGYIGANHGWANVASYANPDGKTLADVGSTWTDGTREYVLLDIIGGLPVFGGSYTTNSTTGEQSCAVVPVANLTHVSGATHTAAVSSATYTATQLKPCIKERQFSVFVDGNMVTGDGTWNGDVIDFHETYTVIDYPSLYDWAKAHVGVSFHDHTDEIAGILNVTHKYTYRGQVCRMTTNLVELKPIALTDSGFIQSWTFSTGTGDRIIRYIPGVKPVGGYDFAGGLDLAQRTTAPPDIKPSDLTVPSSPPAFSVDRLVRTDGSEMNIVTGYMPFMFGEQNQNIRKSNAVLWHTNVPTLKNYPVAVTRAAGWGSVTVETFRAFLSKGQASPAYSRREAAPAWGALVSQIKL